MKADYAIHFVGKLQAKQNEIYFQFFEMKMKGDFAESVCGKIAGKVNWSLLRILSKKKVKAHFAKSICRQIPGEDNWGLTSNIFEVKS